MTGVFDSFGLFFNSAKIPEIATKVCAWLLIDMLVC